MAHLALHPRYNLISSNCQDMVEILVRQLCDGRMISQAKLKEELSLISPKIALDLMVAKFKSRMDAHGDQEDAEKVKEEDDVVKEDVDIIRTLWNRLR